MTSIDLARLIVPLDTSATAESVLPWAALVARDHAMEVHLLTVWSSSAPIPGFELGLPETEILPALEQYLSNVAAKPSLHGITVTSSVRSGDVVEEIRKAASERPGSMVMLCSHGERGYQEAYIGSVTDKLLRTLHVPVLVIPAAVSS